MFSQYEVNSSGFRTRLKDFGENAWILRAELASGVALILLTNWFQPALERSAIFSRPVQYVLIAIVASLVGWLDRKRSERGEPLKRTLNSTAIYCIIAYTVGVASLHWHWW